MEETFHPYEDETGQIGHRSYGYMTHIFLLCLTYSRFSYRNIHFMKKHLNIKRLPWCYLRNTLVEMQLYKILFCASSCWNVLGHMWLSWPENGRQGERDKGQAYLLMLVHVYHKDDWNVDKFTVPLCWTMACHDKVGCLSQFANS